MFVRVVKFILVMSLVSLIAACGKNPVFGKNGNFRLKDAGPDEFAVLPTKELQQPENYATLPPPTLGSANRVDLTPERDVVAALGGKPELLDSKLIGRGELPLITAASRFGVSADIRERLAAEDAALRNKNKLKFLRSWYSDKQYLKRFGDQALKPYDELIRLRAAGAAGVRIPTAPPAKTKKKILKLGLPKKESKPRKGQNI